MDDHQASSIKIGKKAFFSAFFIILALMLVSGILTKVVPAGSYERVIENGREMVVPGSFQYVASPDFPVWRWFTSPVEVLFAKGNIVVITIIVFLVFVGGSFTILEKGDILKILLSKLVVKFMDRKYLLMGLVIFFFMFSGAVLGIFEAMVPLVIFIVPLAHTLGWDSLTGLGMSLLALAFGFSAAITNPFTIGVAQKIAELPLFSGAWLRIIFFIVVYVCVFWFVSRHAKKVERDPGASLVFEEDTKLKETFAAQAVIREQDSAPNPALKRAIIFFSLVIGFAVVFIIVTSQMPSISFLAFPVVGLLFLVAGVGSGLLAGMGPRSVFRAFSEGTKNMLPGVVLILMAISIKHIITSGGIMDTILFGASSYISTASPFQAVFLVFALTMGMNFFIGSASAKAFLMMPILTPLADLVGITRQVTVLAFDIGDGFSNMLYPSNPLLMIALGFTVVSYPKWIKWTLKLQGIVLAISLAFMGFAVWVGYGPF
jgi:uncharacterized ion transporter superfamily protein YfcC